MRDPGVAVGCVVDETAACNRASAREVREIRTDGTERRRTADGVAQRTSRLQSGAGRIPEGALKSFRLREEK